MSDQTGTIPVIDMAAIMEAATVADFTVVGDPVPQGSMRAMHHRSSGKIITTSDNARTRPWKDAVTWAASEARRDTATEPVVVTLRFAIRRPKGHSGKRGLLPSAPTYPGKKPDLDKLVRAVLDSLVEAKVLEDDALVASLQASKAFADGVPAGVHVRVWIA